MPGKDDEIVNQIAEIYNLPDKKKEPLAGPSRKILNITKDGLP